MKNPDLCERPYCRTPYTKVVGGWNARGKRGWTLNVCDDCAKVYEGKKDPSDLNQVSVQAKLPGGKS